MNKISGVSSAAFLRKVKFLYRAKKAGHSGTLDPMASGMLPICFGEATKFSQFLLKSDKFYRVGVKLGARTDTFDSLGRVVCIRHVDLDKTYLIRILDSFIGKKYQVPPMFSALKYFGKPLYQYARKGISISRKPRLINIYKISLIQWNFEYIELEIFCSSGTYIRSFVDDLGESLGCGAHVVSLRRLFVGSFSSKLMLDFSDLQKIVDNMKDMEYLKNLDSLLYPIDILVQHIPEVNVSFQIFRLLQYGQKVKFNKEINFFNERGGKEGLVRITVGNEKRFFGIGDIIDKEYLLVRRLLSFS